MATVVLDNGTGYLKIGTSQDNYPQYQIPCLLGVPHPDFAELSNLQFDPNQEFLAEEVLQHRDALQIHRPMDEGIVNDWDKMEKLWKLGFNRLGIETQGGSLLLTEAALNPLPHREKMVETFMEKFQFSRIFIQSQAVLSLYGLGMHTGVVLDSGDGVSHCIPVMDGQINKNAIQRINLAGRHLTSNLMYKLSLRGYQFHSQADFETVRDIKEKVCYVAYDIGQEKELAKNTTVVEKEYQLPNGAWVKVGAERFEAIEGLFSPFTMDRDHKGVSQMVWDSIQECPMDTRSGLYGAIVLSGGSTMFPGFSSRLERDLNQIFRKGRGGTKSGRVKIVIRDPAFRKHLVYIGGVALANMIENDQSGYWITRQDYELHGPSIARRK